MIKKRKIILLISTISAILATSFVGIIILRAKSSNYEKFYNFEYKYDKNGDILLNFNLDKNFASKIAKAKFLNKNLDSEFVSFQVDKSGNLAINHPFNLDDSFKLVAIEIQKRSIFKTSYDKAPIFKSVSWDSQAAKLQFNKNLTANQEVFLVLKNEDGFQIEKKVAIDTLGQSSKLTSKTLNLDQKLALRGIYFIDQKTKANQPINLNDLFVEFDSQKAAKNPLENQEKSEILTPIKDTTIIKNSEKVEKKFSIIKDVELSENGVNIHFNFIDPELISANLVLTINSEDGHTKLTSKYGYFDFDRQLYHFSFAEIPGNNKYFLSNIYYYDAKNKLNEIRFQNSIENFSFIKYFEPVKLSKIQLLKSDFIDQVFANLELEDENELLKQGDQIKVFADNEGKNIESIGEIVEKTGKILLNFHFHVLPNKKINIKKLEPLKIKKKLWFKNANGSEFHKKIKKPEQFSLENKIEFKNLEQTSLNSLKIDLISENISLENAQISVNFNEKSDISGKIIATNYQKFNPKLIFDNINLEKNKKYLINKVNLRQKGQNISINFSDNFIFDTTVLTLKELKFKEFSENKLVVSAKILNNDSKNLTLVLKNNSKTFKSTASKIEKESVEFSFENVNSNRIFTFDKIETDKRWIASQKFEIGVEPKGIEVGKTNNNFTNLTINSANFSAELKSLDNVFSENQIVSAILAGDNNLEKTKFQGRIKKDNDKWVLNFNFNGLKSDKKYKIQQLFFNHKPEKAWKNYNLNNQEGVFYDSSVNKKDQFEFSTIKNTVGLTIFDETSSPFDKKRTLKIQLTDENKFNKKQAKLIFRESGNSDNKEIESDFFGETEKKDYKAEVSLEKTNTFYELVAIKTAENEKITVDKSQSSKIIASDIFKETLPLFSSNHPNSTEVIIPFDDKIGKIKENDKAKVTYKNSKNETFESEATVENSNQENKTSNENDKNLQYLKAKFQDLNVNEKYQIETIEFGTETKTNYYNNKENQEKFSFENDINLVDNLKMDEKNKSINLEASANFDLSKTALFFDLQLKSQDNQGVFIKLYKAKAEKINQTETNTNDQKGKFRFKFSFDFLKSEIQKIKTGNYTLQSFSWKQNPKKEALEIKNINSTIKLTSFDDIGKEIEKKWVDFAKQNRWKFPSEISETEIQNALTKTDSALFSDLKIINGNEKNLSSYLQPRYELNYLGCSFSGFLKKENFNFVNYNIQKNPKEIWGFGDTKYSTYLSYKYRPEEVFGHGNTYWYLDNDRSDKGSEFKMIPQNVSQYPHGYYVEAFRLRFFDNSDYTPVNKNNWWKDYISVSYEDNEGKTHKLEKDSIGQPYQIVGINSQLSLTINIKKRLKKIIINFNNKMGNKYIAIGRVNFVGFANKNKDF
ncbi:hypothetical protein DR094_00505 [Mycoplasma flocculare]|uniref:Uncharacterized protein n=1 Tax=Mesomycoplasma flocculare TaxID=2128 RepID=A0AAW9X9P6_MESFC|nr:hypothetical protein [Mesomycoplasma flocculare]MXR56491.1 hypothetical protein [Mesomycoplasma flocculare]